MWQTRFYLERRNEKTVISKEQRAWSAQKVFSCAILGLFILVGCKPSDKPTKPEKIEPITPLKETIPALTINLATINLSRFDTRYYKNELEKLAEIIKREDIQILTVWNIRAILISAPH